MPVAPLAKGLADLRRRADFPQIDRRAPAGRGFHLEPDPIGLNMKLGRRDNPFVITGTPQRMAYTRTK